VAPKTITARLAGVELSEDDKTHIIYIPDQTQVLEAGREYEFRFDDHSLQIKPKEGK
jgi:hypothetical protein